MSTQRAHPDSQVDRLLRLRAAEVGAYAGVNADFFALVDEGRNLDYQPGFELGGLGDAGGGGQHPNFLPGAGCLRFRLFGPGIL